MHLFSRSVPYPAMLLNDLRRRAIYTMKRSFSSHSISGAEDLKIGGCPGRLAQRWPEKTFQANAHLRLFGHLPYGTTFPSSGTLCAMVAALPPVSLMRIVALSISLAVVEAGAYPTLKLHVPPLGNTCPMHFGSTVNRTGPLLSTT